VVRKGYVARVHWFRRPPYLRWAAAVLLVGAAAWLDLRPDPVALRPFAAVDLPAGTVIGSDQIEWRKVHPDLLPDPGDPVGMVSRSIMAGEPVLPSTVAGQRIAAPEGWWTLEAQLPGGVYPGQEIQLIVLPGDSDSSGTSVPGVVIAPAPASDPLAFEELPGLIAVPGEFAARAAVAVAEARVTMILGGGTSADSGADR